MIGDSGRFSLWVLPEIIILFYLFLVHRGGFEGAQRRLDQRPCLAGGGRRGGGGGSVGREGLQPSL